MIGSFTLATSVSRLWLGIDRGRLSSNCRIASGGAQHDEVGLLHRPLRCVGNIGERPGPEGLNRLPSLGRKTHDRGHTAASSLPRHRSPDGAETQDSEAVRSHRDQPVATWRDLGSMVANTIAQL